MKTILNWEERLSVLQVTLFLYALVLEFLQLILAGDELFTKVKRNEHPFNLERWTKKAVNFEILGANFKREMPQREHPETTYSPDESEVDFNLFR
jgi:hypothetical protein